MPTPLPDTIDLVVAEWAATLPGLAVDSIEIVTRIGRLRSRFDEELAGVFARFDLSSADFAVIAALRRAGAPYQLPQSALMTRLRLTSGTISVRLTRLAGKGVIERGPSPDDARGALVMLTAKGQQLFDDVAPVHLANEDVLLSALTAAERHELAGLLRKLLVGFEHERSTSPLGVVLAPAHLARRMRAAVGLSDTPGLLVVDVEPDSTAATAGLQTGDLLVAIDGSELRSCVTLADHSPPMSLDLLRGTERHTVTIRPTISP